jgi:isoleucyl-tRNA synthetase
LNRGRLKGDFGENECLVSLKVLYSVLLNLIILLSPIIPFITEDIYQNLKNGLTKESDYNKDSIHYLRIPEYDSSLIDENIERVMNNMITVIELGRKLRENKKINLKMPIETLQVINYDKSFLESVKSVENYVIEELNVNKIEYVDKEDDFIILSVKANFEELYTKSKEVKEIMKEENREKDPILIKEEEVAKNEANKVIDLIKKLKPEEIRKVIFDKKYVIGEIAILPEHILINKKFKDSFEKEDKFAVLANNSCGIRISLSINEEMMYAYFSREVNIRLI